ncbi:Glycerol-3-phosphate cytidylyltransferase [compost metagenome]
MNLLKRLKELGDHLIVAVSTDEFNAGKNKQTIVPFADRIEIVRNIKHVDMAIAETSWDQKVNDIKKYGVSTFGMGHDWEGKFDELKEHCEVVYLPRTPNISSTDVKKLLKILDRSHVADLKQALDLISSIVGRFE